MWIPISEVERGGGGLNRLIDSLYFVGGEVLGAPGNIFS